MTWIDWLHWGINISIGTFLFSYLLRPILPVWYNEAAEAVGTRALLLLTQIPTILQAAWLISSSILYYIGMFGVLTLLLAGMLLFGYTFALELGYPYEPLAPWYSLLARIAGQPAAWAGATVVVAATVAIGNAWNLRLTRLKFGKELTKLDREEKKASEEELKKKRAAQAMAVKPL